MRARLLLVAALALTAVAAADCYSNTINGTALRLQVSIPSGLGITQLRFSLIGPDGGFVLAPTLSPTSPGNALGTAQSERILLDDSLGGSVLTVDVEGLAGGAVAAYAEGQPSPPIVAKSEVTMPVVLTAGSLDGGIPDGGSDGGSDAGEVCASGALVAGPVCGPNWCWEFPLPSSVTFNSVWASDDCQVFAVGYAGVALHKVGGTWNPSWTGVATPLYGVWGSGPDDVWAVGDCETIVHWTGSSWTVTNAPNCVVAAAGRILLYAVAGTGPQDAWAAGYNQQSGQGVLFHWNGSGWTQDTSFNSAPVFSGLWFAAPNDGWAVSSSGSGRIWRYNGSWGPYGAPAGSTALYAVYGLDSGQAWAVGQDAGGAAYYLQLSGTQWIEPAIQPTALEPLTGVWAQDANDLVGVGASSVASLTSTGWSYSSVVPLRAVTGVSDGTVWGVGATGAVARGTLLGLSPEIPTTVNLTKPENINAVVETDAGGPAWAVGNAGITYARNNGVWAPYATPPLGYTLYGLALENGTPPLIWAAGERSMLAVTDGGGTWAMVIPPDGGQNWSGITASRAGAAQEIWLSGTGPLLERVTGPPLQIWDCPILPADAGVTLATRLEAVASGLFGTVAVGDQGTIVTHVALANNCTSEQEGSNDLRGVWWSGAGDIWAVGAGATVLHGTLGGPWQQIAPPNGSNDTFYAATGIQAGGGRWLLYVVGTSGAVYSYNYSGVGAGWDAGNWSSREFSVTGNTLYGVTTTAIGEVLAVGSGNSILHRH